MCNQIDGYIKTECIGSLVGFLKYGSKPFFLYSRKIFKALKSEKGSDAGIFKDPQKAIQFDCDSDR